MACARKEESKPQPNLYQQLKKAHENIKKKIHI